MNYTDIDNSFNELEKDINRRFNIYNSMFTSFYKEHGMMISNLNKDLEIFYKDIKQIKKDLEYLKLPWYKKIWYKIINKKF